MSKNTNKSNNELNKSSSNISDVINKIKTESQKLFVFPSDIVSMIIDKFTKYFNNDLSNVRCCDICSGNYEFINEFIKLKVKSITTKYLDNNLIKYYDELFRELSEKTGIKMKDGSNPHPHTLRHSRAMEIYDSINDIEILQKLLGHKDISTTQIYAQVRDEKVMEVQQSVLKGLVSI